MPNKVRINLKIGDRRATSVLVIPDPVRAALVFSLLVLPACAATFPSLYRSTAEDNAVAPQPAYADTYANQPPTIVAEQVGDEATVVAQLSPSSEHSKMRFESIDESDPCVWAQQRSLDCSAVEIPESPGTPDKVPTAEMRLKMSGLTSPELHAFDADQTINEIGRGRATSVAAQAIGEEFLNPIDLSPETPVPHPDLQTLPENNSPPQRTE